MKRPVDRRWSLLPLALIALPALGQVTVDGIVESTSGGFKFPNGTVQTTAAGGPAYAQILVVAKTGGDFSSIQSAIDSIGDAAATKRYLVHVAPGDYSEQVTMARWVDIEGAGESATTIIGTGAASDDTGTLVCASDAEVRFLAVRSIGAAAFANAIFCDGTSPRLTHVKARASDGTGASSGVRVTGGASPVLSFVTARADAGNECHGIYIDGGGLPLLQDTSATCAGGDNGYGIRVESTSPEMMRVSASSDGATQVNYGVFNEDAATRMAYVEALGVGGNAAAAGVYNKDDSDLVARYSRFEGRDATAPANWGVYNAATTGSVTVLVSHSRVFGATATIRNDAEFTTRVTATLLDGGAVDTTAGGTVTCILSYDEGLAVPPTGTCP